MALKTYEYLHYIYTSTFLVVNLAYLELKLVVPRFTHVCVSIGALQRYCNLFQKLI
jgi:hypothetical protein